MLLLGTAASSLLSLASSDEVPAEQRAERAQDPILRDAISKLSRIPSGQLLMQKAASMWHFKKAEELLNHLKWDVVSRTDAVLIRHLDPKTGKESRERQVTVYLAKTNTLEDLVLDIAHELVHATSRPAWDPYDPTLTPGKYIWAAIEGEGGEVEAVISECKVSMELKMASSESNRRCSGYFSRRTKTPTPTIDLTKVKRDFYRVGKWGDELHRELGREVALFPLLSNEDPKLISSTGRAPYPVSLLNEYRELTTIACENSRKRAAAFGRGIASASQPARQSTASFLDQRCKSRTF